MPGYKTTAKPRRHARRVSDHILIAFHQACDQGELEVAGLLLSALEMLIAAPRLPYSGRDPRHETEILAAADERLWDLRHPESVE
jgi:hypothetical protein